jgi:hypothetical protein
LGFAPSGVYTPRASQLEADAAKEVASEGRCISGHKETWHRECA